MTKKLSALAAVLHGLMRRYKTRVPDVAAITQKMISANIIQSPDEIENDHIAFRTMGVPNLGIASLEKIFLHYGYTKWHKCYCYFRAKNKRQKYGDQKNIFGLPQILNSLLFYVLHFSVY